MRNLVPTDESCEVTTPFCSGSVRTVRYKPWLNEDDADSVLFVSTHGYGKRDRASRNVASAPWFYPGSGETVVPGDGTGAASATAAGPATDGDVVTSSLAPSDATSTDPPAAAAVAAGDDGDGADGATENAYKAVLNVGLELPPNDATPGTSRVTFRDAYRNVILPKLIEVITQRPYRYMYGTRHATPR